MKQAAIGVDIGGTKIAAGIVTVDGAVLAARSVATDAHEGGEAVMARVISLCQSLGMPDVEIVAVGVGTAGQVDYAHGVISYANENLPGWTGMPVAERIRTALGVPVFVENDVNVLAIGEGKFGAGRGFRHLLYIAVGTGIGGAVVLDGKIWRGASNGAGEVGYLVARCDDDGQVMTVEELAAGPGIAAHYNHAHATHFTLHEIAELAERGDHSAVDAIVWGARLAGSVLGGALSLLDPEMVIVGGGVPTIGALWWEPFEQSLRASPIPVRQGVKLAPAQLSTHAAIIGAAWMAFDALSIGEQ